MRIGEPPPPPDEPDPEEPAWLLSKAWQRADLMVWGAHGGAGACHPSPLSGHRRGRAAADHRLPVDRLVRPRRHHRGRRGH